MGLIDLFIGNAHGQEQIQYVYLYINSLWIKKKDINNNIREYLDTACFHGNHLKKTMVVMLYSSRAFLYIFRSFLEFYKCK
jgi:hypothetical protein